MRMKALFPAPFLPESSCKRAIERITVSTPFCSPVTYDSVRWAGSQKGVSLFFISILHLQFDLGLCYIVLGGGFKPCLSRYSSIYCVYKLDLYILFCLDGLTAYAGGDNALTTRFGFYYMGCRSGASFSLYICLAVSQSMRWGCNNVYNPIYGH